MWKLTWFSGVRETGDAFNLQVGLGRGVDPPQQLCVNGDNWRKVRTHKKIMVLFGNLFPNTPPGAKLGLCLSTIYSKFYIGGPSNFPNFLKFSKFSQIFSNFQNFLKFSKFSKFFLNFPNFLKFSKFSQIFHCTPRSAAAHPAVGSG